MQMGVREEELQTDADGWVWLREGMNSILTDIFFLLMSLVALTPETVEDLRVHAHCLDTYPIMHDIEITLHVYMYV